MSSRQPFRRKRDDSVREQRFLNKIKDANVDCPELTRVCVVMGLADALQEDGWRVKVCPFELYPLLHVRGTKMTRGKV